MLSMTLPVFLIFKDAEFIDSSPNQDEKLLEKTYALILFLLHQNGKSLTFDSLPVIISIPPSRGEFDELVL